MPINLSQRFDYAIIGSGIAGMIMACYLSAVGKKVILLEKNNQLGGALQVFSREKHIFDTGVHYVGSMGPGQTLNQIFDFLGILNRLDFQAMEMHGFDRIKLAGDPKIYQLSQGWNNFIRDLSIEFPDEESGLIQLVDKIKDTIQFFGPYSLQRGNPGSVPESVYTDTLSSVLNQFIKHDKLKKVLTGNALLYAYHQDTSPFFVFALILNSYVAGAFRFCKGGSQIANQLSVKIHEQGGKILKRARVSALVINENHVTECHLEDGRSIQAENFIANIHPAALTAIFPERYMRKAYSLRVNSLENYPSFVTVYLVVKPDQIPYFNFNYYCVFGDNDTGNPADKIDDNWPEYLMISAGIEAAEQKYVTTLSILMYGNLNDFKPWQESANTVSKPKVRGPEYEKFKSEIIDKTLRKVETVIPGIRDLVIQAYCATPLTIRDYLNSPGGSVYGIRKSGPDYIRTRLSAKTPLKNLYLTGQNIDVHGIYGSSISALVTLSELPDIPDIYTEINQYITKNKINENA